MMYYIRNLYTCLLPLVHLPSYLAHHMLFIHPCTECNINTRVVFKAHTHVFGPLWCREDSRLFYTDTWRENGRIYA